MIDYIKFVYETRDSIEYIIKKLDSDLQRTINSSGEIKYPIKSQYKGFSVRIWDKDLKIIEFQGSFHKRHFLGQNYERYIISMLQEDITEFCQELNISPSKLKILNLEIGVNIKTYFAPYDFLRSHDIFYMTSLLKFYDKGYNGKELGCYTDTEPKLKLYDKGKQFNLNYNLFRIEIKYKTSRPLSKFNIYTLDDLLNANKITKLAYQLVTTFNKIFILYSSDELSANKLEKAEINLLMQGENAKYWEKLFKTNKRKFNYQRDLYRKLLLKLEIIDHSNIIDLIEKEIQNCTNTAPLNIEPLYKYNDTLKYEIEQTEIRHCKSCGKELNKNQRFSSKYCSPKFVGEKEAHKCRNINSNNRNNAKNKINKILIKGDLLFPIDEIFKSNFIERLNN